MIEFQTKMNNEAVKSLTKMEKKKVMKFLIGFAVLFIVCGVLFAFILPNASEDLKQLGILLLVFGVIYPPIVFFIANAAQKKTNKSMKLLSEDTEVTYKFDDDKVWIIQQKGEDFKATTEAAYRYFFQVIKTKTHYFLYIANTQCHVIPKDSLVSGNLEDLDQILRRHFGTKFIEKN